MTNVMCEKCKKVFKVEENTFTRGEEIIEHGFKCPHCEDITIAYKTNDEVERLQNAVRKERERANRKIRSGIPANKAERKLRQAQRRLKRVMEELNGK